jgi:hypothetical protein
VQKFSSDDRRKRPMPERPTILEDHLLSEITEATNALSARRVLQLDQKNQLTPSQCALVGQALFDIVEIYENTEDDGETPTEEDFEDTDSLLLYGTALLVAAGQPWEIYLFDDRTLQQGSHDVSFRYAVDALHGWVRNGFLDLIEPAALSLECPHIQARSCVIKLAEELVSEHQKHLATQPEFYQLLSQSLEKARSCAQQEAPELASIHAKVSEWLVRSGFRNKVLSAGDAAKEAVGDTSLNQKAYELLLIEQVATVVLSALNELPDFTNIFESLVEICYPRTALEHNLEQYYTIEEAHFDELFNYDYEEQATVACRIIHQLVDASLNSIRFQTKYLPPEPSKTV